MRADGEHPSQSVEVIIKADEILQLLRSRGELTIAEIAEGVQEPRSSVHRLISTLEDIGFVEPGPRGGGFQLGLRLFRLGKVVASRLLIREAARPAMERLLERTGNTIFLMVQHGRTALCVHRLSGTGVQSMAVAVGGTLSLHVGAAPPVLLAHADPEFVDAYLDEIALTPASRSAGASPTDLQVRLASIRDQGYAVSDNDLTVGIAEVAAPVRDAAGEVVAALAVSGAHESVIGGNRERTIERVREAAEAIVAPSG